jgi:hypothetical protein
VPGEEAVGEEAALASRKVMWVLLANTHERRRLASLGFPNAQLIKMVLAVAVFLLMVKLAFDWLDARQRKKRKLP